MKIRIRKPYVSDLVGIPLEETIETVPCPEDWGFLPVYADCVWIVSRKIGKPVPLLRSEYKIVKR